MIEEMEKEKITIIKDGKEVECDVLFTFESEDTLKTYIGYTDHSIADNGRKNIYVSALNPLNPESELEDITDEDELAMVQDVLRQLDEDANK